MPIPSLAEWKAATELGVLIRRSDELRAIDERIAAYHRAVSAYGRSWEAREIRIALDAWKAKRPAGQNWTTSATSGRSASRARARSRRWTAESSCRRRRRPRARMPKWASACAR